MGLTPENIKTAPVMGYFLAENKYGDWIRVKRYDAPISFAGENAVISDVHGKWWAAKRWMPLPAPPAVSDLDQSTD